MTTLKPGDIVQHPEHGFGFIVLLKKDLGDEPASEAVVRSTNPRRNYGHDWDLTGWERVETVRPGHVQVRVDDLDPQTLSEWSQYAGCDLVETALLRVGCASIARQVGQGDPPTQRAESAPPADEPEHGEKPTSATVTLPCPDCGEAVTDTATVGIEDEGGYYLTFANSETHTCPPAQPDEPTLFGARIVVTDDLSGKAERWCRQHDGYWANEDSELMTWAYLCQRGTVTLGWDE